MFNHTRPAAAALAAAALLLGGASAVGAASDDEGGGLVGFILPDSASSVRWEVFDRPAIEAACAEAGIECIIQNAEGSVENFSTIADQLITQGIDVLAIVNLDSDSGAAVQERAAAAGIKNIDYDRLTLNGHADVYVSFDNVAVGVAQGEGLLQCLGDDAAGAQIVQLHGSPTDNNATLFREGYDSVLLESEVEIVADEAVPNWDNQEAATIFAQLLTSVGGEVDGVLAANDGLSLAAQAVLADNGLTVPTTGQDASVEGLRAVLGGTQCMTVYKPVPVEAQAAVDAAVALLNGDDLGANATIDNGNGEIPYVQAEIQSIFIDSVHVPVDDGFVTYAEVCTDIEDLCADNGVTDPAA